MSDHPPVAVFWDYENCSPPSNSVGLGYDIVNNIRRIARLFGSVTTFRAYLDIAAQSSPKSLILRSELQSSGVSIIDCPHNGKKDVVDKMVLADMLAFAIDHSTPATIFLITGDRDYAYAVSILKLRRYHVILIVPSSPHASTCLESQASLVIDWNLAILRNRTEALNSTQAVRQPYLDLDPSIVANVLGELQDVSLDDSNTPLYPTSTAPRGSSRLRHVSARDLLEPSIHSVNNGGVDSTHDPTPASPGKCEGLPIPKTPSRPRQSVSKGSTRPRSATFATQSPPAPQREVHTKNSSLSGATNLTESASPAQRSLPPLDALDSPFHVNGSAGEMPSGTHASRGLNYLASPFVLNKPPPAGLESVPDYPIISLANNDDKQSVSCSKSNADNAIRTLSRSATPSGKRVPSPAPMFLGVVGDDDDDDDDDDYDEDDDDNESAQSAASSPPSSAPDHSAPDFLSALSSSGDASTPISTSDALEHDESERRPKWNLESEGRPKWNPEGERRPTWKPESEQRPKGTLESERCPKWTLFRPLIQLLIAARENGVPYPSRSMVAVSLVQLDSQVYQRAGVTKFRDYTTLAEQAGIIELGGMAGDAWITLHPNWFEASDVSTIARQPPSISSRVSSPTSDPPSVAATNPLMGSKNPGVPVSFTVSSTITPLPNSIDRLDGGASGVPFRGCVPTRRFQPLIDVLVRLRAEGSHQTLRSIVGQLLGQEVYTQAGVAGFREYVLQAAEAQFIQCGGVGGHAWIRLHPELRT